MEPGASLALLWASSRGQCWPLLLSGRELGQLQSCHGRSHKGGVPPAGLHTGCARALDTDSLSHSPSLGLTNSGTTDYPVV